MQIHHLNEDGGDHSKIKKTIQQTGSQRLHCSCPLVNKVAYAQV